MPTRAMLLVVILFASLKHIHALQLVLAAYMGVLGLGFAYNFVDKLTNEPRLRAALESSVLTPEERIEKVDALNRIQHGNFGGVVWWQWPRLLHSCMLLTCAVLTFADWEYAYVFACLDIAIGIVSGAIYYGFCSAGEVDSD